MHKNSLWQFFNYAFLLFLFATMVQCCVLSSLNVGIDNRLHWIDFGCVWLAWIAGKWDQDLRNKSLEETDEDIV